MSGTPKRIAGPAYLAISIADIYTPPASTIYTMIYQINLANVTTSPAKATLYIDGTGGATGGKEICKGKSLSGSEVYTFTWYNGLKMLSTDFLTGLCDTSSAITIIVTGTQHVV